MAAQMTSLNARFLWHQFKAGPWLRLLLIPFGLLFIFGGAWVGTWLSVMGGAFIGTSTLITTFYPEQEAFRAYGMNAARARQQLLLVTVPVILLAVVANVVFVPLPAIAAAGALTSAVMGAIFVTTHGAVGDQSTTGDQEGRAIKPSVSLPFQAVWRKSLIWATVAGIVFAAAIAVSAFISNETLALFVASVPVLAFFARFGQESVRGGISPLVARSYGMTRKQWVAHVAGVSAVSGLLLGGIAGAVTMLLTLDNPDVAGHPFVVVCVAVFAFCLFVASLAYKAPTLTLMAAFLLWFGIRDLLRFEEATIMGPLSIGVLVVSAVITLVGAANIALYLSGRSNITPSNMERMGGMRRDA